jgi:hypothetical protein
MTKALKTFWESMNIYLKELILDQENMKLKSRNLSVQQFIHQDEFRTCMLKDKVKDELNRMEARGIITKAEQPTKWVNPIVVVKKPNGDVRICLDPVDLNKVIRREHYPLKTVEEVAATNIPRKSGRV